MSGTVTLPYPNVCRWRDEQVSFGHSSTGGCVGWFQCQSKCSSKEAEASLGMPLLFFFYFHCLFYFLTTPHSMWDLSSLPREGIYALCIGNTRVLSTGPPGRPLNMLL